MGLKRHPVHTVVQEFKEIKNLRFFKKRLLNLRRLVNRISWVEYCTVLSPIHWYHKRRIIGFYLGYEHRDAFLLKCPRVIYFLFGFVSYILKNRFSFLLAVRVPGLFVLFILLLFCFVFLLGFVLLCFVSFHFEEQVFLSFFSTGSVYTLNNGFLLLIRCSSLLYYFYFLINPPPHHYHYHYHHPTCTGSQPWT